jgi:hypothetical protein
MIDGRRREAKLMREVVAELTAHIGGRPSAVQKRLIERTAVLQLRLTLMDAQAAPDGTMSERNAREYLCWHNSYVRTLRQLGLKGEPPRQPTLQEILTGAPSRPPAPAAVGWP